MKLRTGLSYGDVLLVPQRSAVDSRSDVDLSTRVAPGVEIDVPLVSSPMDTVTESALAVALGEAGGLGTIHRFMSVEEQAEEVARVVDAGQRVGAAVGINEDTVARAEALVDARVDVVMIDVAHGHLEKTLSVTERLDAEFDVPLVVGNVATPAGVEDLYAAGADAVKVGVGPGSHCITREVAGAGVPQLTAVDDCANAADDLGIPVMADGGIRFSGDAAKALMAGADTVMMGTFFAGTTEAPGQLVAVDGEYYKRSRGMASSKANAERTDKRVTVNAPEGVEALSPYRGALGPAVAEFCAGIRSGLSYCGGHTIAEARERAEFVRVAPSAAEREGAHGVALEAEATLVPPREGDGARHADDS